MKAIYHATFLCTVELDSIDSLLPFFMKHSGGAENTKVDGVNLLC